MAYRFLQTLSLFSEVRVSISTPQICQKAMFNCTCCSYKGRPSCGTCRVWNFIARTLWWPQWIQRWKRRLCYYQIIDNEILCYRCWSGVKRVRPSGHWAIAVEHILDMGPREVNKPRLAFWLEETDLHVNKHWSVHMLCELRLGVGTEVSRTRAQARTAPGGSGSSWNMVWLGPWTLQRDSLIPGAEDCRPGLKRWVEVLQVGKKVAMS